MTDRLTPITFGIANMRNRGCATALVARRFKGMGRALGLCIPAHLLEYRARPQPDGRLNAEMGQQGNRMSIKHRGSCLCGGVQFTIQGPLAPIQVCHCTQCRRAQGGPVATNVPVEASALLFLQGEGLLQQYESSPGKTRAFCKVCGSPVYSKRDSLPGVLRIRAGLLHAPVDATLAFHAFTGSKASWWPIEPGVPAYPEGAP